MGGASRTSFHAAPSATRNVPFITPSRCAASPIRMLAKCCSAKPVSSPIRNRHIPCHIRDRFVPCIDTLLKIHPLATVPHPTFFVECHYEFCHPDLGKESVFSLCAAQCFSTAIPSLNPETERIGNLAQ